MFAKRNTMLGWLLILSAGWLIYSSSRSTENEAAVLSERQATASGFVEYNVVEHSVAESFQDKISEEANKQVQSELASGSAFDRRTRQTEYHSLLRSNGRAWVNANLGDRLAAAQDAISAFNDKGISSRGISSMDVVACIDTTFAGQEGVRLRSMQIGEIAAMCILMLS